MSRTITFPISEEAYKVLLDMSDVCGTSVPSLVSGLIEEAYPSLITVVDSMARLKAQGEQIKRKPK